MVKMLAVTSLALVLCTNAFGSAAETAAAARVLAEADAATTLPEGAPILRVYDNLVFAIAQKLEAAPAAVAEACAKVAGQLEEDKRPKTRLEVLGAMAEAADGLKDSPKPQRVDLCAAVARASFAPREKRAARTPGPGDVRLSKKPKADE